MYLSIIKVMGFPGGAVDKNPPTNSGDKGLALGPGRVPTWRSS